MDVIQYVRRNRGQFAHLPFKGAGGMPWHATRGAVLWRDARSTPRWTDSPSSDAPSFPRGMLLAAFVLVGYVALVCPTMLLVVTMTAAPITPATTEPVSTPSFAILA